MDLIKNRNLPAFRSKALLCERCGEMPGELNTAGVKLFEIYRMSDEEIRYIRARFAGRLCIPCLRQLRTAFKIRQGDFDRPNSKLM